MVPTVSRGGPESTESAPGTVEARRPEGTPPAVWYLVVTMASRIGIRELRDGLTGILRRVENGEPVEVTRDGVVIAVLSPASGSALDIMLASGEAIAAVPLDSPIQTRPSRSGIRASNVLQDDRDQ